MQLMERSSAVVLAFLGSPATVPVLVCTSRVGQMLTQLTWALPDSALVGLAQLGGENQQARLREVMLSIVRLHLIVSCLMACAVLAVNPAFVRIWVGEKFFGGLLLNLLLAVEVISASFVHGVLTVIGAQSHRLSIGLATLWQGAVYLALALALTRRFSLPGLLTADLLSTMLSTLPVGLWLLRSAYGLRPAANRRRILLHRHPSRRAVPAGRLGLRLLAGAGCLPPRTGRGRACSSRSSICVSWVRNSAHTRSRPWRKPGSGVSAWHDFVFGRPLRVMNPTFELWLAARPISSERPRPRSLSGLVHPGKLVQPFSPAAPL